MTINVISDIRKCCHVNTNENDDRFVGVKLDSTGAVVHFPIGYQLPESDEEIRKDIKHLFNVLSEFTQKQERVLAVNKFNEHEKIEFPINAYLNIIDYYINKNGKYYMEIESSYITNTKGNIHWSRTFRNQTSFVQKKGDISSLIYTKFTVKSNVNNDKKIITQIHRYCVYESFKKLGWLYTSNMPEPPGVYPNLKESISILNDKIIHTFNDDDRRLFKSMKDMLEYMDERTTENEVYFGTYKFEIVWERLIDKLLGEKNKEQYFPRIKWILKFGKGKEKKPLIPDTIMVYNNKYYVLDAKYYRYGFSGNPNHLPNTSDINKQITYGEYIEKTKNLSNESLFNAFIMPYNMKNNPFGLSGIFENIGEAIGYWRKNNKNYERIQGIVADTRTIMFSCIENKQNYKVVLSNCIESFLLNKSTSSINN